MWNEFNLATFDAQETKSGWLFWFWGMGVPHVHVGSRHVPHVIAHQVKTAPVCCFQVGQPRHWPFVACDNSCTRSKGGSSQIDGRFLRFDRRYYWFLSIDGEPKAAYQYTHERVEVFYGFERS